MDHSDSNMGPKKIVTWDMYMAIFLDSTWDNGNVKRQRHATLAFLKIVMRHQDPPSKTPSVS